MKSLVFLGCLLAVAAVVRADELPKVREQIRELIELCINEGGMTEEVWEMLESKSPEEMGGETKGKSNCLYKCMLQKMGVFDDGILKKEIINEVVEQFVPDDEEKRNALQKVLGNCADEANNKEDECEIASIFTVCYVYYMTEFRKQ